MATHKEKADVALALDLEVLLPPIALLPHLANHNSNQRTASVADGYTEKIIEINQGAKKDKALALLATHHVAFDANSPEAKRVLRKIDQRIIPMVLTVYVLMLLDKNSLSFANIMGIKEETHLSASEYSWLGSIV